MTTVQDDIVEVVRRLSPAQRQVIRAAWAYADYHRQGPQVSYCPVAANGRNAVALERIGMAKMRASGGPRLTPLGLRVRDHLLSYPTGREA